MQHTTFHAFCIAAPRSGEGKTTASIALMRALARRGLRVQGSNAGRTTSILPSMLKPPGCLPAISIRG
ncbi:MAG: hypothetical protein ACLRWP_20150 [Bilophila wadsworthia]